MKTILEILRLSTSFLEERGLEGPRRAAEEVVSGALGMKRLDLYLEFERPLAPNELQMCRDYLQRRAKGEPIQYILGEVPFYDCMLRVTPEVLIPRPETEQLVDNIVGILKPRDLKGKVLWDVCCGSGCIAIALKKHLPQLEVVMADRSASALEIARENARRNGVQIETLHGDLLEPFKGRQADFLVSNPPYVAAEEFGQLQGEVRGFEPIMALVSGDTGLEFYERFARELPPFLHPGGRVWFELGHTQAAAVSHLFQESPWQSPAVSQDWAGIDRFFSLEKQA